VSFGFGIYDVLVESPSSLIIGDAGGVARFSVSTGERSLIASLNGGAGGVTFGPDGHIYATGFGVNNFGAAVVRVHPATGQVTSLLDISGIGHGLVFDTNGDLLFTAGSETQGGGGVSRLNLTNGQPMGLCCGSPVYDVAVVAEPTSFATALSALPLGLIVIWARRRRLALGH
jgi:hypothetical protein